MAGVVEFFSQCFGLHHSRQKENDSPRVRSLQQGRPRINNMPYRNSMAGSMYYLGVSPSSQKAQANGIDQDGRPQHIRFRPDMPTRASQLAIAVQACPAEDSVFVISSPGSVSPFSMNTSPTVDSPQEMSLQTIGPFAQIRPSAGNRRQLISQQSRSGRPSLTVQIPQSTRNSPIEVFPSANSNLGRSPGLATSTSFDTPAHAGRLSAHRKRGSAKTHEITNLGDELAAFSLSSSGGQSPPPSARS